MTLAIAALIVVLFVSFSALVFNVGFASGKAEGYEDGCRDCARGVIPQHNGIKVFGSTGTVGAPDLEVHMGISETDDRSYPRQPPPAHPPRHLSVVDPKQGPLRAAEDDPSDGA